MSNKKTAEKKYFFTTDHIKETSAGRFVTQDEKNILNKLINNGTGTILGKDGREIELRVAADHIQWRYKDNEQTADEDWIILISLDSLKGADGATPDMSNYYTQIQTDEKITAAISGVGGGSTPGQSISDWKPLYDYKKNDLISYDNKLYLVITDFTSAEEFMYDTATMFLVTARSTGNGIQFWEPNTNYKVDDVIYFNNMLYRVNKGHQTGAMFARDNLSLIVTDHNATDGIQGEGVDYFHLTAKQNTFLNNFSESFGKLTYKGALTGNMNTAVYDKNENGIVDKAETLLGLNMSVQDLNDLKDTTTTLQTKVDAFSKGMVFKGEVATREALNAISSMVEGHTYIVSSDETQNNNRTYYIYQSQTWLCLGDFSIKVRNFVTEPINLSTETIGILKDSKIESTIARKTDLHAHSNLDLLSTYTQTEASIKSAVDKAHNHPQLSVINKFSENGSGDLLFNGKPISQSAGGGIYDLSDFTTDDLVDYPNKRYVTNAEKLDIAKIPTINTGLNNATTNLNTVMGKIPASVNASNPIMTSKDVDATINSLTLESLSNVTSPLKTGEYLVVDASGKITTSANGKNGSLSISDKNNNSYQFISKLKFNKATIATDTTDADTFVVTPDTLYSTDMADMPTEYSHNMFLVADANTKSYVQRNIDDFTAKLGNKSVEVALDSWSDGACEIIHGLSSECLIVAAYENKAKVDVEYVIVNENTIKLISETPKEITVVINSTQGTVSNATIGASNPIVVTSAMFIDDKIQRTDKTYSSSKIESSLAECVKKVNVYTKAETDAKYGLKTYEHAHDNTTVLSSFKDLDGKLYYGKKEIFTDFNPTTFVKKFNGLAYATPELLIDTSQILVESGIRMINAAQILMKNNSATEVAHLIVNEGDITIVNVELAPGESQQYQLGISPDIRITVNGEINANYTLTGF